MPPKTKAAEINKPVAKKAAEAEQESKPMNEVK
jgi:hypothetical protein